MSVFVASVIAGFLVGLKGSKYYFHILKGCLVFGKRNVLTLEGPILW